MPEEESILNESNLFPLFNYGKILFAIKYFVTFLHLTCVIHILTKHDRVMTEDIYSKFSDS